MPVESPIYWDSVGSQRSTSGGSSGDAYSSGSASRHYVDPWDLENYAYLRRHSVAGLTQQASRHQRRPSYHHLSHDPRAQSEYCDKTEGSHSRTVNYYLEAVAREIGNLKFSSLREPSDSVDLECRLKYLIVSSHTNLWYSSSAREPGYDAPAFVEELYCGPPRPGNNSCYYHQPIYEDEVPDYVAPFPVYAPLSEIRHGGEFMEDHRRFRHRCKSASMRDLHRSEYVDLRIPSVTPTELGNPTPEYRSMVQIIPPPHIDLNTYGHLKIDYTNSWNSLNRKIRK
ncbi:hypothetical protein WN55_07069 [Dufourea novaeangliae]|uniref:Uncharacterized protein n=1 Tax=Dufourea novaeangliae TaxID=178035 RepID=A0A154PR77_DUFNO|nr:hypothetical protein WN55_07069 [Dufourea novaeangliae]